MALPFFTTQSQKHYLGLSAIVCQYVRNRKPIFSLFGSFSRSMRQHLCSPRSGLQTYRPEMVIWHKEMGNATGATGYTGLGKSAPDDACPSRSSFIPEVGESQSYSQEEKKTKMHS